MPLLLDAGASQARDAKQGSPRSEGIVPLPATRSVASAGGRRAAPQGVSLVKPACS